MSDDAVIRHLALHYAGALDTRALWRWAGGPDPDPEIPFERPPQDRWQALWARAESDAAPSRIALAREALFDRPGQAPLLDFLRASAPSEIEAPVWCVLLEEGPELDAVTLAGWLAALPDPHEDSLFAALAPSLASTLGDATRQTLERLLEPDPPAEASSKVPQTGESDRSAESLETSESGEPEALEVALASPADVAPALDRLLDEISGELIDATDDAPSNLVPLIARLRSSIPGRSDSTDVAPLPTRDRRDALDGLLAVAEAHRDARTVDLLHLSERLFDVGTSFADSGEPPGLDRRIRALRDALWATRRTPAPRQERDTPTNGSGS